MDGRADIRIFVCVDRYICVHPITLFRQYAHYTTESSMDINMAVRGVGSWRLFNPLLAPLISPTHVFGQYGKSDWAIHPRGQQPGHYAIPHTWGEFSARDG